MTETQIDGYMDEQKKIGREIETEKDREIERTMI